MTYKLKYFERHTGTSKKTGNPYDFYEFQVETKKTSNNPCSGKPTINITIDFSNVDQDFYTLESYLEKEVIFDFVPYNRGVTYVGISCPEVDKK